MLSRCDACNKKETPLKKYMPLMQSHHALVISFICVQILVVIYFCVIAMCVFVYFSEYISIRLQFLLFLVEENIIMIESISFSYNLMSLK
jgi:hypothetical protein